MHALPAQQSQPSPEMPPAHPVLAMMINAAQSQVLRVAAQLGIVDLLRDGPKTVAELAEATGTQAPALARIMRALVYLDLVVETGPQQFTCTPLGTLLQADTPTSLRGYALIGGSPLFFHAWPQLLHSVQTGTSGFAALFGMPFYTYLQHHPAEAALFYEAMTSVSHYESLAICEVYDFSTCHTVVDVGGGRGYLLAALLRTYPALQGILLDLPPVIDGAQTVLAAEVAAERCQLVGGDFLAAIPAGGDMYLIKRVLVDRDDTQAHTLLRHCREAMGPQGRVLVADPDLTSPYGLFFDLAMLMFFGGESRIRTETELRTLFASAGLQLTRTMATSSALRLVEGVPA